MKILHKGKARRVPRFEYGPGRTVAGWLFGFTPVQGDAGERW